MREFRVGKRQTSAILVILGCVSLACNLHHSGRSVAISGSKVEYRTVRHSKSGASIPQLTHHRSPVVQDVVNRQLESLAASLQCDTQGNLENPDHFDSTTRVTYAADEVLSLSVHASYYCGGPYPTNDANLSMTFDMRTGLAVSFEELFSDYERDAESIARALYPERIARAEHLAATGHEEPGETCDDAFTLSVPHLLESGFSYALSEEGLIVQPNFPHVSEACAEQIVVPYARLRQFAAPDGILARVADANRSAPN